MQGGCQLIKVCARVSTEERPARCRLAGKTLVWLRSANQDAFYFDDVVGGGVVAAWLN